MRCLLQVHKTVTTENIAIHILGAFLFIKEGKVISGSRLSYMAGKKVEVYSNRASLKGTYQQFSMVVVGVNVLGWSQFSYCSTTCYNRR
jgi:hypothetical protein